MFAPRNTVESVAKTLADGFESNTIALQSSRAKVSRFRSFRVPAAIAIGSFVGTCAFLSLHVPLPISQGSTLAEKYLVARYIGQWLNFPIFIFFAIAVAELVRSVEGFRREYAQLEHAFHANVVYSRLWSRTESERAIIDTTIWLIAMVGFLGTVLSLASALHGLSISSGGQIAVDVKQVTTTLGRAFDHTATALAATIPIMIMAYIVFSHQSSKLLKLANRLLEQDKRVFSAHRWNEGGER